MDGDMAIYCMSCGAELPEEARYCWKCGAPQQAADATPASAAQPRWEYTDIVVPLDFAIKPNLVRQPFQDAAPLINTRVYQALSAAAQDGWQPETPTDAASLMQLNRIRQVAIPDAIGGWKEVRYLSAIVRVRRPVY
jgi:zinc-ribbon domain